MDLVSGWNDENFVYLVRREGAEAKLRRYPAQWAAYVSSMNDEDRRNVQRCPEVKALKVEGHYTRVEFRSRWERDKLCRALREAIEKKRTTGWKSAEESEVPEPAVLEADVSPLRRLLSDNGELQISTTPRTVWLDLELDPRKTFQEMTEGKARILCYSLYSAEGHVADDVLEADSDVAEAVLLGRLFDNLLDFDLVLSWNGKAFDFPALQSRLNKLKVRHAAGRFPMWKRWCWLDHMNVFKKYNQAHKSGEERTSTSLDSVARYFVGEGKADFPVREAWDYWVAGGKKRAELVSYCNRDTALMPMIEAKTGFIALHLAVCRVTRCFPDDSSLSGIRQADGFMLRLGAEQGYHFPTKLYSDEEEEKDPFEGAFVMPPKLLGVIDGVDVCDFAGLYPSIMRTWNMSHDTLLDRYSASEWKKGKCVLPSRETHFRTDKRGIFPIALDTLVAQRETYKKKEDAAAVGSTEWYLYQRLSNAFKIVNNSMYGVTGAPASRFYDVEIAEGIAATGKWLILHVAATAEAAGLNPFYGDTDSIFVKRKKMVGVAVNAARSVFASVVKTLNESWVALLAQYGVTKSFVKLDFEKSFARLVLKSAKCYAGCYEWYKGKPAPVEMKPEIKGLEFKRGDAMRLARHMQAEAIDMLLRRETEADGTWRMAELPTDEDFRVFVDKWRRRLLEAPLVLEELVQSKSVKSFSEYKVRYTSKVCSGKVLTGAKPVPCKYDFMDMEVNEDRPKECPRCKAVRNVAAPPVHVRVAKMLEARGELVGPGTRIEFLIVRPSLGPDGKPEGDGKLVAAPAHDDGMLERIDRDYYWDHVYPPTERILQVVYSEMNWRDSANLRRKAAKEAALELVLEERRAGKVDDLPLFGAAPVLSTRVETEEAVDAPPLAAPAPEVRAHRLRRAPRVTLGSPIVVAQAPVVVRMPAGVSEKDQEMMLTALRAAAEAHPGGAQLKVLVSVAEGEALVATELRVARTRAARQSLVRLLGESAVAGMDV